jgi:endoglucanase
MRKKSIFTIFAGLLVAQACVAPSSKSGGAEGTTKQLKFTGEPTNGDEVPENPLIVVDQFGYRPEMHKVAVLAQPVLGWNAQDKFVPGDRYEVRRFKDGKVVFSGKPVPWNGGRLDATEGDRGFWFDFSAVEEPGSYFVYDPKNGVRSFRFEIAEDVYRDVLKAAVRMYYFNRANVAKVKPYACVGDKCWTEKADYVGPGQDKEARSVEKRNDPKTARDLSGGWWDAGDTNKYVTFAQVVVHQLLSAYEQNPKPFTDDYNIPESGNGIPDLLDEVKVELDWMKKMQPPDLNGGVLIKVGNVDHGDPIPALSKHRRYYYPEPCSSSTIVAASVFSHAALVYRKFEEFKAYAEDLGQRAVRAWDYYKSHPRSDSCDDGTIKSGDADRRLEEQDGIEVVAAVYLFALTGDKKYDAVVRQNYGKTRPFTDDRFGVYDAEQGDALLYYAGLPNGDPELKKRILERKQSRFEAVDIYGFKPELDLYRSYMRRDSYHWGSNQPRANVGNVNQDLLRLGLVKGDDAKNVEERVQGIVNFFHGVNPMQLVYLSNMQAYGAERSASEMFHTWFRDKDARWDSALKSQLGPAPGYVVGGPNKDYCKDFKPSEHKCAASRLKKQPPGKAYLDFNTEWDPKQEHDKSWEITEPAIYYQSAYVKLLSNFVD